MSLRRARWWKVKPGSSALIKYGQGHVAGRYAAPSLPTYALASAKSTASRQICGALLWRKSGEHNFAAGDNSIASLAFGPKHSLIRQREQLRSVVTILREAGEAGANRHLYFLFEIGRAHV